MKFLRPDREHHKLPSMTVAERIQTLQGYDPEMVVAATWEGTLNPITPENFEVMEGQLWIDVDTH